MACRFIAVMVLLLTILFSAGCSLPPDLVQAPTAPTRPGQQDGRQPESTQPGVIQPVAAQPAGVTRPESGHPAAEIPVGPFEANEAGRVMVLMYHQIGYPEAEWTRTPEHFRDDLDRLYRQGYRLVSLLDYVNNNINLPRGYSPVVLTFDDASEGQFKLLEKEGPPAIDPQSAVGIIQTFAAEHPGFGTAATFYTYYPNPFRQPKYIADKYRILLNAGMDIGNHTIGHQNLSTLSDNRVQQVLAEHVTATQRILPGYQVESIALPYGVMPRNSKLATTGEYDGVVYHHQAVLLVGANPALSPVVAAFNPAAIPRIRGSDPYIGQWLDYFQHNPEELYVSDGDPGTVTIPETRVPGLDKVKIQGRTIRSYRP